MGVGPLQNFHSLFLVNEPLFFVTETRLGRVFVQEPVLTNANTLHILDHERASHIVEEAEYIGLGTCYCRHKMLHAGHPCEIGCPIPVRPG